MRSISSSSQQSVAGIILAAGSASRMKQPKLLLHWQGEQLIRRAARTALKAGLSPVIVVTGSGSANIQDALLGLDVKTAYNQKWAQGQSTSVRVGIESLPAHTDTALFLLGDQPYVSVELLDSLVQTYFRTRPEILAPFVGEKRTNPVLFDHSMFSALCKLQGDAGARSIFVTHPPTPMNWTDQRLLLDIDTPDDYRRLLDAE